MKRLALGLLTAALVLGTGTASASSNPPSTDPTLNSYVNIGAVADTSSIDAILSSLDTRRGQAGALATTLARLDGYGCSDRVLRDIWRAGVVKGTQIANRIVGSAEQMSERCAVIGDAYDGRDAAEALLTSKGILP